MRKFLSTLVAISIGLILIVFAVANRHLVKVSLNPFNSADPSVAISLPLFVLIIAVAIAGVIAGGSATWFRQRRWRRAARRNEADARQARAEAAELRGAVAASQAERRRLPAPAYGGLAGAVGRDKQGATL